MRVKNPSRLFFVAAALLFFIAVLAVLLVRRHGVLAYQPALLEALAPRPLSVGEGVNLNDERAVVQPFRFEPAEATLTHVGVGIANLRGAPGDALVLIEIRPVGTMSAGQARLRVGEVRSEEMTSVPLAVALEKGADYELVITSQGVKSGKDITLFYESDATTAYRPAFVRSRDTVHQLTGHVGFQLLQYPRYMSLAAAMLQSPFGMAAVAIIGLVVAGSWMLWPRVTQYFRPLSLPQQWSLKGAWWELVLATIVGSILAVMVTASFYSQLNRITASGDAQRALVYRAVARTSALQHGEVGLWEPYLCGGEPLLANMESAQLDPFFVLVLLFGENLGMRLSVTATLIIGFVGTYVLARRFGAATLPALLAGGLFTFSGFQMLGFANGNFAWIPVGFIPWVVYFYLASLERWPASILAAGGLAFIFFDGSLHMTVYAVLAIGFLGGWLALLGKTVRPVAMLGVVGLFFVPLVAIKLLPVAEVQAVAGDFLRPPPFIQPWSWWYQMFIDRDQLATPQWTFTLTGENFRWTEYGAYVGLVPVLLAGFGIVTAGRSRWKWVVIGAAFFLLLMTFGAFPWTVLHRVPFLEGVLRNPQRARVVFLLFFGILAAWGLTALARRWVDQRWVGAVTGLVVGGVLLDLVLFHAALYPRLFALERPALARVAMFERITESYSDEPHGYYKVSYENYRAGQGTTDMCMPYLMGRGVYARGKDTSNPAQPYFGEAMLTSGGQVEGVAVAGNYVTVGFVAEKDGWLVINQNFFPGWRAVGREVRNREGLVAARVAAGDRQVVFHYAPRSYHMGRVITALALVIAGLLFWRVGYAKK